LPKSVRAANAYYSLRTPSVSIEDCQKVLADVAGGLGGGGGSIGGGGKHHSHQLESDCSETFFH